MHLHPFSLLISFVHEQRASFLCSYMDILVLIREKIAFEDAESAKRLSPGHLGFGEHRLDMQGDEGL